MTKGDKSAPSDVRTDLRNRLAHLRARQKQAQERIQRSKDELVEIDEVIGRLEAQLTLALKVRGQASTDLGQITRKNSEFQETWLLIQIAFKGPKGSWFEPDPRRGMSSQELYKYLRRAGKGSNESTFRSYLHRLKGANLLWKHNHKWHLTEDALAGSESLERKGVVRKKD